MMSITPRQRALLTYLVSSEVPPSYLDMARAIGVTASSSVHRLLRGLGERGYISRTPGARRAVQVLKMPPPAEAPIETNPTRAEGLAFARAWRERSKRIQPRLYAEYVAAERARVIAEHAAGASSR